MKELVGRLIASDPVASEELRIIQHFDQLVRGKMGVGSLLREAAMVSRSTLGYVNGPRRLQFSSTGLPVRYRNPDPGVPRVEVTTGAGVWLEVGAASAPGHRMVLDRVALAIEITEGRDPEENRLHTALEVLLSTDAAGDESEARWAAAARLHLDPEAKYRAVASAVGQEWPPRWPSALMATPWGPVRGAVLQPDTSWDAAGGIGVPTSPLALQHSWRSALFAWRLSGQGGRFSAESLGPLLTVLEAAESSGWIHPDRGVIEGVLARNWSIAELQAIADGASVRAIASAAGLHHSTVQLHLPRLSAALGFDVVSPIGRIRLQIGLLLRRIEPTAR
ncbi:hypothetical protein [uncultured Amnibacterium sp.]|uniref:hypothetical protein n=1 Tax=uncultured Amnibacterium sp. TaxID=1631851 RepID=UPI0035CC87BA